MITKFSILDPDAPLSDAVDKILATTEQNFIVASDKGYKRNFVHGRSRPGA